MAYVLFSALCSAGLETLGDRTKELSETTASDMQPALRVHSLWVPWGVNLGSRPYH